MSEFAAAYWNVRAKKRNRKQRVKVDPDESSEAYGKGGMGNMGMGDRTRMPFSLLQPELTYVRFSRGDS